MGRPAQPHARASSHRSRSSRQRQHRSEGEHEHSSGGPDSSQPTGARDGGDGIIRHEITGSVAIETETGTASPSKEYHASRSHQLLVFYQVHSEQEMRKKAEYELNEVKRKEEDKGKTQNGDRGFSLQVSLITH